MLLFRLQVCALSLSFPSPNKIFQLVPSSAQGRNWRIRTKVPAAWPEFTLFAVAKSCVRIPYRIGTVAAGNYPQKRIHSSSVGIGTVFDGGQLQ